MGILTTKAKFKMNGPDGKSVKWKVHSTDRLKEDAVNYVIERGGKILFDQDIPVKASEIFTPRLVKLTAPEGDLEFEIGWINLLKIGAVVRRGGQIIHRTHNKPFRSPGKLGAWLEKVEVYADQEVPEPTEKEIEDLKRAKEMGPELLVDIGMGVFFFFFAREFGLLAAALTGAAITVVLYIIERFVKVSLLGGFATFGVIMALISAGLAYTFQDDLFIKLRGSIMAVIGMSAFLFDGIVLKGDYLGKRMAKYMAGLFELNPRKGSFAVAASTLIIMGIDTPLAFLLTTEQWIWYNSFLDSLISMPIVIGMLYLAREKKANTAPVTAEAD